MRWRQRRPLSRARTTCSCDEITVRAGGAAPALQAVLCEGGCRRRGSGQRTIGLFGDVMCGEVCREHGSRESSSQRDPAWQVGVRARRSGPAFSGRPRPSTERPGGTPTPAATQPDWHPDMNSEGAGARVSLSRRSRGAIRSCRRRVRDVERQPPRLASLFSGGRRAAHRERHRAGDADPGSRDELARAHRAPPRPHRRSTMPCARSAVRRRARPHRGTC
jgi:hypothetical protein